MFLFFLSIAAAEVKSPLPSHWEDMKRTVSCSCKTQQLAQRKHAEVEKEFRRTNLTK